MDSLSGINILMQKMQIKFGEGLGAIKKALHKFSLEAAGSQYILAALIGLPTSI